MSISLISAIGRDRARRPAHRQPAPRRPLPGPHPPDEADQARLFCARPRHYSSRQHLVTPSLEASVLSFIDQIVIPFLTSLYGTVGYLGVFVAMFLESTLLPLPSELILPFAGYMVSGSRVDPLTHGPWTF